MALQLPRHRFTSDEYEQLGVSASSTRTIELSSSTGTLSR